RPAGLIPARATGLHPHLAIRPFIPIWEIWPVFKACPERSRRKAPLEMWAFIPIYVIFCWKLTAEC
ncbi:MAG: hypothetical protein ACE5JS_15785, partial [Nitrospinota bacterium]